MRAFILTPTYRVVDGVPEVHLHGVLESGEPCLLIDDRVRPYFFVRSAQRQDAEAMCPGASFASTDRRTFGGEPVVRVEVDQPNTVAALRKRLERAGIECFEADVRLAYRYLIDRRIHGSLTVEGHPERHDTMGLVYRNPTVHACRWVPRLKVLSIDIETSPDAARLYAIALHTHDFSRVLMLHDRHLHLEHAECVPSERMLIRRFLGYLGALDPDIITGWNVVDFDLAVLARTAHHHGIPFAIGRTDDVFEQRQDSSFSRESRAVVYGRVVLDALSLMRGSFFRLHDYKLETAAQALLGRGKLIKGDHRAAEIDRLYREAPQALVDYNLEDARLVTEILDRTGLLDVAVQRSLLTGMPLDRVSAAIASVDSLYLGALTGRHVVAPSVRADVSDATIAGGYVLDSRPGLYRNVAVFDFKSLYPSIIRTFNLDPLTWVPRADPAADLLVAPNGERFRRDVTGILPELVVALATERDAARQAGHAAHAQAIKILMNSLYGVLGAGASRLFCPAVANAITHFGQWIIRAAADAVRAQGYGVIYGDTDSLFVETAEADGDRALELADRLRVSIGGAVATQVRARFACESALELEFEKLYSRFFLPEVRGGRVGSKKRYAGLLRDPDGGEHIEFVGLESVRRDWSDVSKRFQQGLLERVFHDQPVEAFVRQFVADLRAGRFDEELVYRKAMRKAADAYTKTTPQHVQAARKQHQPAGRLVEYVITRNGPEPVGELSAAPDYEHYVTHQLQPVADAVLRFVGTDFAALIGAQRQLNLF